MPDNLTIDVAKEFSRFPAGRIRGDGRYSGQRFREEILVPALEKVKTGGAVTVEMDGAVGYGPSFLEEAFGGLVRVERLDKTFLKEHLKISTMISSRKQMIWQDIEQANPDIAYQD